MTDAALVIIAKSCPALITLDEELRTCKEVSDVGVKAVASGCPLLRSLDLVYCFITDAAILRRSHGWYACHSLNMDSTCTCG